MISLYLDEEMKTVTLGVIYRNLWYLNTQNKTNILFNLFRLGLSKIFTFFSQPLFSRPRSFPFSFSEHMCFNYLVSNRVTANLVIPFEQPRNMLTLLNDNIEA